MNKVWRHNVKHGDCGWSIVLLTFAKRVELKYSHTQKYLWEVMAILAN